MTAQSVKPKSSGDLLRQVLLNYLRASRAVGWPGADGLTDDDIVNFYPQAILVGDVPSWHELQSRFPQLASELQALRSAQGWLENSPSMSTKRLEPEPELADTDTCRLSRWLVSFASGSGWYPVGEFIALHAAAAIERAVDVLGPGAAYRAEEIPWDAAPLSRANVAVVRN
jgi:hypothetical protein